MNADWFAGRLKELREQAGLSREELAKRAGLQSAAGIRNIEQGVRQPSWPMVVALCQALGVSCDAFMQEPASQPPTGRGRPRKATADDQADDVQTPAPSEPAKKPRKKKGKR